MGAQHCGKTNQPEDYVSSSLNPNLKFRTEICWIADNSHAQMKWLHITQ